MVADRIILHFLMLTSKTLYINRDVALVHVRTLVDRNKIRRRIFHWFFLYNFHGRERHCVCAERFVSAHGGTAFDWISFLRQVFKPHSGQNSSKTGGYIIINYSYYLKP